MTDQSRREQKTPRPPDVLADALHDRTHPTSGRLLHASPIWPLLPDDEEKETRDDE